jgi:hypothetical protein
LGIAVDEASRRSCGSDGRGILSPFSEVGFWKDKFPGRECFIPFDSLTPQGWETSVISHAPKQHRDFAESHGTGKGHLYRISTDL